MNKTVKVIDLTNQMTNTSWEEIIKEQNLVRGYVVESAIDHQAFIERIKAKDWSAYFLGKAFCSMYRPHVQTTINLTDVCKLDAEGKNFFFKTVFARDVDGWNCDYLYKIEQEIKEILGLDVDEETDILYEVK